MAMTLEQRRALAMAAARQRMAASKAPAAADQPDAPLAWSDVPGRALYNAPASAGQFVGDIYNAVRHPIDTVSNLGDLGAGALREGARAVLPTSVFNSIDSVGNQQAADRASATAGAVKDFYVNRYGSGEGFKHAIAEDPVGVLSDISMPLTGGGGLVAKAPGMIGRVGRAAQVAGELSDPAGLVARGISRGAGAAANRLPDASPPPINRAIGQVEQLGDQAFGPYNAMHMDRAVHELGRDAVRGDVLGEPGYAAARQAANLSPTARQTIQDFGHTRQDGQNVRLAQDLQAQADLPPGSRLSVDDLREAAAGASRPPIDQAYQAARTAGNEIDFNLFDNIITTEVSAPVFQQAIRNVSSRAARNPAAGGNLAVLDETRRLLSGMAEQGYASRDPMASVYGETARALTQRLDEVLQGDVYAEARMLREQAHRADDAFVLGEELGQRNVPIDAPTRAGDVAREHTPNVAAAYAQTKVGQLVNNNDTAAALTGFQTDQGRAAYTAALGGENGANFGRAVDREATYRRLPAAVQGNSTTARQLHEMITGGALGATGAGMSALAGLGSMPALGIGALGWAAGQYGLPYLKKLADARQVAAAPDIANMVVGRGPMPVREAVGPGRMARGASAVAGMNPQSVAQAIQAARQGGIVNDIASQFGGPR